MRALAPSLAAIIVVTAGIDAACDYSFDRTEGLEPGSVHGRVVDETGAPVPFAVVARDGSPAITRAGKDGTFTLRGLSAGPVALRFSEDVDGDGVPERAAIRALSIDAFADPSTHKPTLSAVLLGDVSLALTTSVVGKVFDTAGTTAPGVVVVVYRRAQDLAAADVVGTTPPSADLGIEARSASADDGSFVIPGIAPGAATVAAFRDDGAASPAHHVDVSGLATDAGPLTLGPPGDRSVTLTVSPAAHDGTVVDIVRPGGDPKNAGDVVATSGPLTVGKNGGTLSFTAPVGIWDLYASDGATSGALTDRAAPPSLVGPTDVLAWGTLLLGGDDGCRRHDADRDGDGVPGLPAPTSANDPLWAACASTCGTLFGAALLNDDGTPKTCTVANAQYDCDDDNDGQPDVTEPIQCIGLCNGGGDRDGDGICDDADPFPLCAENEPAVCKGAPAFTPPAPVYTSGEGEGEGAVGEGEGEGAVGEGEGAAGEGEGEGEGEGAPDPCLTNFGLSSQTDVVNFAARGCTHVNVLIIDSTGNPVDPVTSLQPLSALTTVDVNLSISGTNIVDTTGLENLTSVGNNFTFSNNTSLASVTFPALTHVGGLFAMLQAPQLASFLWPSALTDVGGVSFDTVPTVDITSLTSTIAHIGSSGLSLTSTALSLPNFPALVAVDGPITIKANGNFDAPPGFPVLQTAAALIVDSEDYTDAGTYPALTTLGSLSLTNSQFVTGPAFPVLTSISAVVIRDNPQYGPTSTIFPATTTLGDVTISGFVGADLSLLAGITLVRSISVFTDATVANGLVSFHGLESLQTATAFVSFTLDAAFNDASALSSLAQTGDLIILGSDAPLTNITFPALTTATGVFDIESLPALTSVSFPQLTTLGGFRLLDTSVSTLATSFGPLAAGQVMRQLDFSNDPNLTSLAGFESVVRADDLFVGFGMDALTDISALSGITQSVTPDIENNAALQTFGGALSQLQSATTLTIKSNPTLGAMPSLDALQTLGELDIEDEPFTDGGSFPSLTTLDHVELNNLPQLVTLPSLPAVTSTLSAYNITATGLLTLDCLPATSVIGVSSNASLTAMTCASPQSIGTMGFTNDPSLSTIQATLSAPLQGLRLDLMTVGTVAVPIANNAHDLQLLNSNIPALSSFATNVTSLDTLDIEGTSVLSLDGLQSLTSVATTFTVTNNAGLCNHPTADDVLAQLATPPANASTQPNCF